MRKSHFNPLEKRDAKGKWTKDETRAWLSRHPIASKNIVDMFHRATPGEREAGQNWYPNAHKIAVALSKRDKVPLREAAGLLADYSPQTAWGRNTVEASEVERTQTAIGGPGAHMSIVRTPGELQEKRVGIMAPAITANRARGILAGQDFEDVFAGERNKSGKLPPKSLKVRAFGELIAHGGQPDPEHPMVVIDRHAAGVARGVRFTDEDYNIEGPSSSVKKFTAYSNAYRAAARQLSKEEGREVTPEEVQATTWLTRQRLNGELDSQVGRTRKKLGLKDSAEQLNYFASYEPDVADIVDNPMVGYAELSNGKYRLTNIDLAYNPTERRDAKGRWTKSGDSASRAIRTLAGTMTRQDKFSLINKATDQKSLDAALKKSTTDGMDPVVFKAYQAKKAALENYGLVPKELRPKKPRARGKVKITEPTYAVSRPADADDIILHDPYDETGGIKLEAAVKKAAKQFSWKDQDERGSLPDARESVHEQRRAQMSSWWWYGNTQSEDAADEDQLAGSAWSQYQSPNYYGAINAALRRGETQKGGPSADEIKAAVNLMFESGGYTTEKPITVFRALKSDQGPDTSTALQAKPFGTPKRSGHNWAEELKPGTIFTDKGIVSTTAHEKFAEGWLTGNASGVDVERENPNDVVVEIQVPKGTRIVGGHPQFIETMLAPGTRLRVTGSERRKTDRAVNPLDDTTHKFEYTHVTAEVVPNG